MEYPPDRGSLESRNCASPAVLEGLLPLDLSGKPMKLDLDRIQKQKRSGVGVAGSSLPQL